MYNFKYVVQTAYFLIMEIFMKKLIAAAVATSVSAIAVADVSITGNAKYEYFNSQTGTDASTNKSNTEVNLSIKGKKGDTGVVMNLEFNGHGSVDGGSQAATVTTTTTEVTVNTRHDATSTVSQSPAKTGTLDIEDLYMTTKVGDIAVKAGNWATGTSALLGEIDHGNRATNKIDLRTKVGGATVYAGNSGKPTETNGNGSTALNQNMYAGVIMNVGGATVELKQLDEDTDAFGIKGSAAGVDYRFEQKSDTAANGDVTFGEVKTSMNGVTLGYAFVDADKAGKITEDDSSIFAVEAATAGGTAISTAMGVDQIMASTKVDGNTVTLKNGSVDKGLSSTQDLDFTQVSVSRALASGANAVVTYTTKDASTTTETDTLEVELNVSF
jgi:hypothetical protein